MEIKNPRIDETSQMKVLESEQVCPAFEALEPASQ